MPLFYTSERFTRPLKIGTIASLLVVRVLSNLSSHEEEKNLSEHSETQKERQSFLTDLSRAKN